MRTRSVESAGDGPILRARASSIPGSATSTGQSPEREARTSTLPTCCRGAHRVTSPSPIHRARALGKGSGHRRHEEGLRGSPSSRPAHALLVLDPDSRAGARPRRLPTRLERRAAAGTLSGSSTLNVVPLPSLLTTLIDTPCASNDRLDDRKSDAAALDRALGRLRATKEALDEVLLLLRRRGCRFRGRQLRGPRSWPMGSPLRVV
jgi:hypothetical protein